MAGKNRPMIEKGQRNLVFKDYSSGDFSRGDLTKKAGVIGWIWHGFPKTFKNE